MTATTLSRPEVVSGWEVAALPWVRTEGEVGVRRRILWDSPSSRAEVLLLDCGAVVATHVHPGQAHHAFVLEGRCRIGDTTLGPGSYFHVSPGEPHDVRGEYPFGTQVLYVFEREEPPAPEPPPVTATPALPAVKLRWRH